MTHPKLTKSEKQVMGFLLKGMSRNAVSRQLDMPPSSVRKIADRLVYYGILRPVPLTKSPVIYELVNPDIDQSPIGDCEDEKCQRGGAAQFRGSPRDDGVTAEAQSDSPLLDPVGVYTGKEPPEQYGRAHIAGSINYDIVAVGTFDQLRDRRGLYIGYWKSDIGGEDGKGRMNGAKIWSGAIRLFSQELTFTYRLGNRGGQLFSLYPQAIFVDPRKFPDSKAVAALFIDRALYVAEVLRQTGWQLRNPVIKGPLHLAWPDHPIIQHFDPKVYIENGDIVVDTSPGYPEVETEHVDTPEGWAKAQLMAELPTRFLGLEARERKDAEAIGLHAIDIRRVGEDLDQISSVLAKVDQALLLATTALSRQSEVTALQATISAQQAEVNNNLIKSIAAGTQRQLDTYVVQDPAVAGLSEKDSTPKRPEHLEGYQ